MIIFWGNMLLSYSMTTELPRSTSWWGWGWGRGWERVGKRKTFVAQRWTCNLQPFSMGGRYLGLQNGGNFSHLSDSERCESFLRFHNLSTRQKNIHWALELRSRSRKKIVSPSIGGRATSRTRLLRYLALRYPTAMQPKEGMRAPSMHPWSCYLLDMAYSKIAQGCSGDIEGNAAKSPIRYARSTGSLHCIALRCIAFIRLFVRSGVTRLIVLISYPGVTRPGGWLPPGH